MNNRNKLKEYMELLKETDDQPSFQHHHQFTTVVEWAYTYTKGGYYVAPEPNGMTATKLRCECGEEWVRSDNE